MSSWASVCRAVVVDRSRRRCGVDATADRASTKNRLLRSDPSVQISSIACSRQCLRRPHRHPLRSWCRRRRRR